MKTTINILLILCCLTSNAQKWAPLGMTWTYVYTITGFGPGRDHVVTWEAEDTITVKGHLCTIIQPKGGGGFGLGNMLTTMATYEDSGRVYWYSPISDTFTILYDFNKKVGESWMMYGIQKYNSSGMASFDTVSCPLKVMVKAIGMDTVNGIPLRTMELKTSPSLDVFDGKVIEGIGHIVRPRPWAGMLQFCAPFSDLADDYFKLRCIDNGTIGFHDFKIAPYCDWEYNSIKGVENSSNSIRLTPNPSNGTFTLIASKKIRYAVDAVVYDILGRIVYHSSLTFTQKEATLQVPNLNGIYLLSLDDKEGNVWHERIVIH